MKSLSNLTIFLILISFNMVNASVWDCFKFFQKAPSEKLIHNLSQKNLDLIDRINLGDIAEIQHNGSKISGTIRNISFKNLVLESSSAEKIRISLSKIKDITIIKKSVSHQANRFKTLIDNKRSESTYLKESTSLKKDFTVLSDLPKEQQVELNKKLSKEIEKKIMTKFETENIGFHFNLNGGQVIDYVNSGGVRASRAGDVALQYGARNAELAPQSYFFRTSPEMSLYDIISMGNMKRIRPNSGRMGNVVNIFKADSNFFKPGLLAGEIKDTGISYIFSERWLRANTRNEIGIPYSTYLTGPLEIYDYKKFGYKSLNRNQVDFLALKQVEFNILTNRN